MGKKRAIIIGAGPAGLTAALELLEKTDITPVILEESGFLGGISRTADYKGNKIDIGGHRFFSKSDRVVNWWKKVLPIQTEPSADDIRLCREISFPGDGVSADPEKEDRVMLLRNRISRIFFLGNFFDYPISLNTKTIKNLGLPRMFKMGTSYVWKMLFPLRNEKNLEDFFVNRFGGELYRTFFRDYTEKVWGVSCREISAEWGAQRIKGLSVSKAIGHFVKKLFVRDSSLTQKGTESSLIEQFMYPKYGPGQLWEEVARKVTDKGGEIRLNHRVTGIQVDSGNITGIKALNSETGEEIHFDADYYFSSMPVRDLITAIEGEVPPNVREVSEGLVYRDFLTVGLLLDGMQIQNDTPIKTINGIIPDNWIYVQETSVKLGRIQVFNNWSPYMVSDGGKVWLGLEYFCQEGDLLWSKNDADLQAFATGELVQMGMITEDQVLDATVIRCKKAYPAYFGSYARFDEVREFLNSIQNLYPIGRNGMHRYNNMDHSMLSAMVSVENILKKSKDRENVWNINADKVYHEKRD